MLSYMQNRILVARSFSEGDQAQYESGLEQAGIYETFLDRELAILGVLRT
jgi:hypothetical protein